MYKIALVVLATVVCVSAVHFTPLHDYDTPCNGCMNFMPSATAALRSTISEGHTGSCTDLCNASFDAETESAICTELCNVVGVETFASTVKTSDPSESLAVCRSFGLCQTTYIDCVGDCALVTNIAYHPHEPSPGQIVYMNVSWTVYKEFAPMQMQHRMLNEDATEVLTVNWWNQENAQPGHYWKVWDIYTDNLDDGGYYVDFHICQTSCAGNQTGHSHPYGHMMVPFGVSGTPRK